MVGATNCSTGGGLQNILRLPKWRGMPGSREGSDTATMSEKVGVEGETQY